MNAPKTFVLDKVFNNNCNCTGCKKKVNKLISSIGGVYSVVVDTEQDKVTVSGHVDPQTVILTLLKMNRTAVLLPSPEQSKPVQGKHARSIATSTGGDRDGRKKRKTEETIVVQHQNTSSSHSKKAVGITTTKHFHPSHPEHELELKNFKKSYKCDGCKEPGFGSRYRCDKCNYDLHDKCMHNSQETSHEFFKGCTFKFFERPPRKRNNSTRYCGACAKPIRGFVYHCEEKGWDLHPCCHNLENQIVVKGDEVVRFWLRDKVSSQCIRCHKKTPEASGSSGIKGWSYESECKKYHLHVNCVTQMLLDADSLTMENLELPLARKSSHGRHSQWWKIAKFLLQTIVGILLGDPSSVVIAFFGAAFN